MGRPKKEKPNRRDGLYEVKITVGKSLSGKPVRKSFYSSVSKADARAKAEQYKIERAVCEATGERPQPKNMTFETWAYKWLETFKKGTVKQTSYENTYKFHIERYFVPYFGKAHIADIQQIDVQKYFNTVRSFSGKPLSNSTLKRQKIVLKAVFESAIDNDLCYKNPVRNIKFPNVSEKFQKTTFTREQAEKVEEYAKKEGRIDVVILLNTGIRRSELLGLQWSDIDFDNKIMHIQRAVTQVKGQILVDKPKTTSSERLIPFGTDFGEYLKTFVNDNIYVIGTSEPLSPSAYAGSFRSFMKTASAELGVPNLTPHELRHTYGTLMRERGVDIYTIQKVLGHSNISVTAGIYVHNDIEVLRKSLKLD